MCIVLCKFITPYNIESSLIRYIIYCTILPPACTQSESTGLDSHLKIKSKWRILWLNGGVMYN